MIANLTAAHEGRLGNNNNNNNNSNIINAYNAEDEINAMRNRLRDSEIEAIDAGIKNYQSSVYYLDIVSELERMGDFLINISKDLKIWSVGLEDERDRGYMIMKRLGESPCSVSP